MNVQISMPQIPFRGSFNVTIKNRQKWFEWILWIPHYNYILLLYG